MALSIEKSFLTTNPLTTNNAIYCDSLTLTSNDLPVFRDQVCSNTRVSTQVNASQHESKSVNKNQHESDANQHESDTSQQESIRVQHESTRIDISPTRVNTSPMRINTNQHEPEPSLDHKKCNTYA